MQIKIKRDDKTPSVAVIMCVYRSDSPDYLMSAIKSILDQSYKCDLFIYQDGKIPEELLTILTKFSKKDNVFIYKNAINNGLAFGLNYLIDITLPMGYQYIARMDSDDISLKDRLQEQVCFLEKNSEIDVLGCYCKEFGSNFALEVKKVPVHHDKLLQFSIARCPFIHPTVIFRSSVFEKGYRYPENTKLTEDMALWFELLNNGFIFSNLDKVLFEYRLNSNTIARRKGIKKSISEFTIRIKNMRKLNQTSLKNITLISFRLIFHILPDTLLTHIYKKYRNY